MAGANLVVNTNEASSGRVSVILALNHGTTFAPGIRTMVKVHFATSTSTGTFPLALTDQIATRCVSDFLANELPVGFVDGTITVTATNAQPRLSIVRSDNSVILSWEAWANEFSVQAAPALNGVGDLWTNVIGTPQLGGAEFHLSLPVTNQVQFFRLQR